MKHPTHWVCWLITALLGTLCIELQAAPTYTYLKDVTISVDFPEDAEGPHGYHPVGLHLKNERNQEIQLTVLFLGGYADHWRESPLLARQDFVLGPLESRQVQQTLPTWFEMPHQVRFIVNGELRDELVSISKSRSFNRQGSFLPYWVTVLTMTSKDAGINNRLDEAVGHMASSSDIKQRFEDMVGYLKDPEYLYRSKLDAGLFSDTWSAYTAWDIVLLTSSQWQALRPAQKRALEQYMRIGGSLVLLQEAVSSWPEDFVTPLAEAGDQIHRQHHDFGLAAAVPAPGEELTYQQFRWIPLINFAVNRGWFWGSGQEAPLDRNVRFPVIDELAVPYRAFIGLLILFVLCIGPLNLWFVMRNERRIWLYATVPALSLCATFVLVSTALVSEGITPSKRSRALVVLDHQREQVMTWATSAVYLPVANRNGMFFSGRNEIYFANDDYFINKGINLNDGMWLQHGWLRTRIPFHYQERGRYPLRERLTVTFDDQGVPSATNSFRHNLENVTVANPAGDLYQIALIEAGRTERLTLFKQAPDAPQPQKPLARMDKRNWELKEKELLELFSSKAGTDQLPPHSYLAVLDGGSYLEDPLQGALIRNERCVLFGRLEVP